MTTRVLNALALRAAMKSASDEDAPRLIARHFLEVNRLSYAEYCEYERQAQGLTRVEAEGRS